MNKIKELVPYVVITVIVILIRMFIISPVRVEGTSMYPTLSNNEFLLLSKYDQSYERFDIVVLKYKNERLVKRIIGLPGETVEYKNNTLYINGKEVEEPFINVNTDDFKLSELGYDKIPDNYYFVVGDNRGSSLDSRVIGLINKKDLQGTIKLSISGLKFVK
jgi:signal peptidase I